MAKKKEKKKVTKKVAKIVEVPVMDKRVESIIDVADSCDSVFLDDMGDKFGPQLDKVTMKLRKMAVSMKKAIDDVATKESKKEAMANKLAEQIAKIQAKMEAM